jgi:uncharacterized membrane protein YdjX (TVP38/TMEM64 family)
VPAPNNVSAPAPDTPTEAVDQPVSVDRPGRGSLLRRTEVRAVVAVVLLAALIAVAALAPIPGAAQLRAWAAAMGPAAAFVLFGGYALLTVAPVPRTVFTLAAGLLLGTVTGAIVALTATAAGASLAFWLARWLGQGLLARTFDHRMIRTVNERLAEGGWLGVASLRLIPVVPFSALNYYCGVSKVRFRPYLVGSVVGSAPGTLAVVIFGDSLSGSTSPALLGISAGCTVLGGIGLFLVLRKRG